MAEARPISEIREAIQTRAFPAVTVWNRLEGRPRTAAFDRALRAEVRDALWMLSRQWQLGEFRGEDAGSPILAKLHVETTRLTRMRMGEHAPEAFDAAVPLEAAVERRPAPMGLDVALAIGRHWQKLIAGVGDYRQAYIDRFPIPEPDPDDAADALVAAHPGSLQSFAAAGGRAMDGGALLERLRTSPSSRASDGITLAQASDGPDLDAAGTRLLAWASRVFHQPPATGEDAWTPERLEYQFACSAPTSDGERVYSAEEHHGGHLDWYSVDADPGAGTLDPLGAGSPGLPTATTYTALPTSVEFEGMPNARWWAFEDGRTNLGQVNAATTDVATLLFLEFALVFSNDWILIPCTLDAGSVAIVRGMAITDVFGGRTWIEPAGAAGEGWEGWRLFTSTVRGTDDAERGLLLLPAVPKIQEGEPVEAVTMVRDEMANMVWGVEETVPLPDGQPLPGAEAAAETLAHHQRLQGGPPAPAFVNDAKIRYTPMTSVPEHWIPFTPVHVPGDERQIQLQRAALPRPIEGGPEPPELVRPRTSLLREGLTGAPARPYFVYEEEVPRSGARVTQSWQRTRWRDGSVFVWLGARKGTGRPTASSGLAFDQAVDVPRD